MRSNLYDERPAPPTDVTSEMLESVLGSTICKNTNKQKLPSDAYVVYTVCNEATRVAEN